MTAFRAASVSTRTACALILALLLGLRLLSPPGFMPTFASGAITIAICPDAELPSTHEGTAHHPGHSAAHHQTCPYAAASSLGTAAGDPPLLPALLGVAIALTIGLPIALVQRRRSRERPPLRGPPLPA